MGAPRRSSSRLSQRRVSLIRNSEIQRQKREQEERERIRRQRKPIQIRIQILTGRQIALSVSPDDSIEHVMEKIKMKEGINPDQQNLLFNGLQLHPLDCVDDYHIQENMTVFLTLRNLGG